MRMERGSLFTGLTNQALAQVRMAWFGPQGSEGFITQSISTEPGATYELTFWLSNLDGPPNQFTVAWNGLSLIDLTNQGPFNWTEYDYNLTATNTSTTLEFGFQQDPSYFLLDDVSVVSTIPEPSTFTTLSVSSLLGVLGMTVGWWRRRKAASSV